MLGKSEAGCDDAFMIVVWDWMYLRKFISGSGSRFICRSFLPKGVSSKFANFTGRLIFDDASKKINSGNAENR